MNEDSKLYSSELLFITNIYWEFYSGKTVIRPNYILLDCIFFYFINNFLFDFFFFRVSKLIK
jgi:hypothetical protein